MHQRLFFFGLWGILLLQSSALIAQDTLRIQLQNWPLAPVPETAVISEDSLDSWMDAQQRMLWLNGYLDARLTLDSTRTDTAVARADYSRAYSLKAVEWEADPFSPPSQKTLRRPDPDGASDLVRQIETRLNRYDAKGYPFARIQATTLANDSTYRTHLSIDPGEQVRIDSVVLKSNSLKRPELVARLLSLQKGKVYNGQVLKNAPSILSGTGYLKSSREAVPVFTQKGAVVFVYAERKKASSANAILGFQPSPDGTVTFTGQADLVLKNTLERGEIFEMHWRRLQASTQEFNLTVAVPYLFGSGVGVTSRLEIFRQDSTFARIFFRNGVTFPAGRGSTAEFYTESRQGSDLQAVTTQALNLRTRYYGLAFHRRIQDRPINPRKGHWVEAASAVGRKILTQTEDNTETEFTQFLGEIHAGLYWSAGSRWVLAPSLDGGALAADQLAGSELFVLGGLNSWRGFDEGFLRASSYARGAVEVRFLLDDSSHLLALADWGWLESRSVNGYATTQPLGVGTGLRFATGNGQFSLIYALGRLTDGAFQFAAGKVHFGFVSYF